MLPTRKSYSIALVLTLWLSPIGLAYSSIELSIILAILTASSTILLGGKFGLNGIIIGYSIIMIFISAPWGVYIFLNKKKKWHLLETFNN